MLWDKVLEAAFQRSLKTEDKDLWKKLDDLFAKRNGILHRGESIAAPEAKELVEIAARAVAWLRKLRLSLAD